MKRQLARILAMACAMTLLLTACGPGKAPASSAPSASGSEGGSSDASQSADSSAGSSQGDGSEEAAVKPDPRIRESLSEEGNYPESMGSDQRYSYHIPEIVDDSDNAQFINKLIRDEIRVNAQESMNLISHDQYPIYETIGYKTYWHGNLLSLVIREDSVYMGELYTVFHYDFDHKSMLSNEEMLGRLMPDLTMEDYLEQVRAAALRVFDAENQWMAADSFNAVTELRHSTISNDNIHGDTPAFVDDKGVLHVAVPIAGMVGAGQYTKLLQPLAVKPLKNSQTEELGFIRATLKNGHVTLSFTEDAYSNQMFHTDLDFRKTYPVTGYPGQITQIHLSDLGLDSFPVLFMTNEAGDVFACSLFPSIMYQCFAAAGPCLDLDPVTGYEDSIATSNGIEYRTTYALTKNGKTDLSGFVDSIDHVLPPYVVGSSWPTYDGQSCMIFPESGDDELVLIQSQTSAEPLWYAGNVDFMGISPEGMIYSFYLWEDLDGSLGELKYEGTMALRPIFWEGNSYLDVMSLTGDDFLGGGSGKYTRLTLAMG